MWGSRYYFEGFTGLWLLASVGLVKVWDWAKDRQSWLRPALVAALKDDVLREKATEILSALGPVALELVPDLADKLKKTLFSLPGAADVLKRLKKAAE